MMPNLERRSNSSTGPTTDTLNKPTDATNLHVDAREELIKAMRGLDAITANVNDEARNAIGEAIRSVLGYAEQVEILIKSLSGIAATDRLTTLTNRDGLERAMAEVVAQYEKKLSAPDYNKRVFYICLVIDLDKFKAINSKLGHDGGDIALEFFAKSLIKVMRRSDTMLHVSRDDITPNQNVSENIKARTGGDEFTLLLPLVVDKNATKLEIDNRVDQAYIRVQAKLKAELETAVFKSVEIGKGADGKPLIQIIQILQAEGLAITDGVTVGAMFGKSVIEHIRGATDMPVQIYQTLSLADLDLTCKKNARDDAARLVLAAG